MVGGCVSFSMGRANGCYDFQNVFTTLRPLRKLPTALTSAQLDRGTANHNTHPHLRSELPIRERETEGEPEQREREPFSSKQPFHSAAFSVGSEIK